MHARRTAAALVALILCLPGSSFSESGKSNKSDAKTLSAGLWGGPHLRMQVKSSGAELEFDCGEAAISEPITLDSKNSFRVSGSLKAGDFGPTRDDAKPSNNVVFTGAVEGDTLKMEMAVTGEEQPRKFTLTRGQEARLFKCK